MKKIILLIASCFSLLILATDSKNNTQPQEQPCITGKEDSCQRLSKQYPKAPCPHCIPIISGYPQEIQNQTPPQPTTTNTSLNQWPSRNPDPKRKRYEFQN